MTYSFGFVEVCHLNVASVMVGEIEEVEGEADPEVNTRRPHEDGVLKALGEVGVAGVPRDVPLLRAQSHAHGVNGAHRRGTGARVALGAGGHRAQENGRDPDARGPPRPHVQTGKLGSQKDEDSRDEEQRCASRERWQVPFFHER